MFSKSQYVKYKNCHKWLWLYKNTPNLMTTTNEQKRHLDVGKQIGELARKKFANGVLVKESPIEIAKAVEKLFEVKVLKVNTMKVNGKKKRVGYHTGKTSDWKKAIVTIDTNPEEKTYLAKGGKQTKISKKYKDLSLLDRINVSIHATQEVAYNKITRSK